MKRKHSQSIVEIFQDEVLSMILSTLKWSLYVSLLVSGVVATAHYFGHAIERHQNEIDSKRHFVEDFCSNDTLVRRANEYKHCERARKIAARDARYEAVMETLLTFHLCASSADPHAAAVDDDGHSGGHGTDAHAHTEIHCAHAWYVVFGAITAFVVLGVCGCCVRRRSIL